MLGMYSTAILVLAAFVVLYHIVHIVIDAAQTGKPFRRFNPVWGPIRLILALTLLIPLPGQGGLNAGQALVIRVSEWGSGLASRAWSLVAKDPEILKPMVAEPMVPSTATLVRSLVLRDACMQLTAQLAQKEKDANEKAAKEGLTPPPATLQPAVDMGSITNGDGSITTTYGWPERPSFCGALTVFAPGENEPEAFRTIKDAHLRGLKEMLDDTPSIAQGLRDILADKEDSLPLRGVAQTASDYEDAVARGVRSVISGKIDSALSLDSGGTLGWAVAGASLDQVLRLNVSLIALASSLPQVDPPDVFLTPPTSLTGADYQLYTKMRQVEAAWGVVPAISPFSAAGIGGLSTILGQAIATSQSYTGGGRVGAQLRSVRDLLRLDDYNWKRLAQRPPLAAMAEFGTYLSGKSAGILAGAGILNSTGSVAAPTVSVLTFLGGLGFMVSLVLMLFTPIIPFVRFVLGIAAWLLALFEAMVAAPLVALMHLRGDEDGMAGRSIILCYVLVLQVALRPVLMIFGLMGGLIVFLTMLVFLNQLFAIIFAGLSGTGQIGSLWFVATSLLYALLAIGMANACFKLIDWLPARTMTWLSGQIEGRPRPNPPSA